MFFCLKEPTMGWIWSEFVKFSLDLKKLQSLQKKSYNDRIGVSFKDKIIKPTLQIQCGNIENLHKNLKLNAEEKYFLKFSIYNFVDSSFLVDLETLSL